MKENILKAAAAALMASAAAYLGTLAVPLFVLLAVMVVDYATGMVKAYMSAQLCSRTGLRGILKKLCYMAMVAVGAVVDYLLESGLGRIVFKGIQDGVQRISTDLFYVVSGHGPTDGENALVPTADQYAQFVAAVKADADRAEAAAERAESAEGVFTQADLEQAVAGYLEENPVEAAPIDATLTQSGQAADAKAVGDAIANIELTPGPQGEKGKDGAAGADGLSMYTVSAEPEMESDTGGTVDPGLIDTGGRTLTAGDLLLSPGGKVYRVLQAADTVICSVSFFADLHGSDGLTPVKGTDYWTEADKAELVDAVLAALPAAEEVSF